MNKYILLLVGAILISSSLWGQQKSEQNYHFKVAKLKYQGGGDWYANPTSLPNLIAFTNKSSTLKIAPTEEIVEPGGTQIYQYPYVYMTGHGNVSFNQPEAQNLRNYLISGGFLHVDDNYGMDKYIRKELKKIFPELDLVDLPFSHPIYNQHFEFPKGLPKVHEHDKKSPQGLALIYDGRVVVYYTYECDLGDGWEDRNVHGDSDAVRQLALQMGANVLIYALQN